MHSVQLRSTSGDLGSTNCILAVVHVGLGCRSDGSKACCVEDSSVVRDLSDIAPVDNAILKDQDRDVWVLGETSCGDQASETSAHNHVVVCLCSDSVGGYEGRKGSQCRRGTHLRGNWWLECECTARRSASSGSRFIIKKTIEYPPWWMAGRQLARVACRAYGAGTSACRRRRVNKCHALQSSCPGPCISASLT